MKKPIILILAILAIDQVLKIWIKLNFHIGEEVNLIGDWCRLHFIENEGMAFGMSFGGSIGKYILTIARIAVSSLVGWYMYRLTKQGERKIVIYSFALIFAGAVGNIIDSLFYGVIFSESTYFTTAELFSSRGGYAPLCLGKVVDMFYFPIIDTVLPDWIPFAGGSRFEFFNAIFNVADIAITIGVCLLVISFLFLKKEDGKNPTAEAEDCSMDTKNEC